MKIKPAPILPAFFLPLIIASVWSCEELGTDSMKLSNDTSQMMYYQALTVESTYLIELRPIVSVEYSNRKKRIIPSGETATLYEEDISGYSPGEDVVFFFYEVIGDSAYISGGLELTHEQLRKQRFQVVIDDEELTTRNE